MSRSRIRGSGSIRRAALSTTPSGELSDDHCVLPVSCSLVIHTPVTCFRGSTTARSPRALRRAVGGRVAVPLRKSPEEEESCRHAPGT